MNRQVFKTLEVAWEYCIGEEIEADILALPPDVDEMTEEDLTFPVISDIPGSAEVEINNDKDDFEEEDLGNPSNEPLGTRVIRKMLSVVEDPDSYFIYFDNFFSSHALLITLKEMGFRATGTIRENRIAKCPIKSTKELEKSARGTYDFQFDPKK